MSGSGVTVEGVDALVRNLADLAYAGASRATGKAIRAGLKVIQQAQQAAAPLGETGNLKRAIGSRLVKGTVKGITTAKAGINVGKGRPIARGSNERKANQAPHGHLVAEGTRPRYRGVRYVYRRRKGQRSVFVREELTGKAVAYTGSMPSNDFISRASRAAAPAATAAMVETLKVELSAEVAKAAKGTGQ